VATSDTATGLRPGRFGPAVEGGRPRDGGPDWRRLSLLFVGLVTSVALVTGGAYAALIVIELRQLDRNSVDITGGPEGGFAAAPEEDAALEVPEVETTADRTTILLVGSDSRAGLTQEQLRAIGTEDSRTDLTDTLILLQVDPATDAAVMLSFPRDLVVRRCDGSRGRINEAFFIGGQQGEGLGPKCLVDTITAETGIEIDHYARVNFAGFVRAVDALGGVTFHLDEPLRDRFAGLDVPAGCVEFDGITAIQFVRARRLDNDFGRIARQQRFAREMIDKATSIGTLVNPARVASLIGSISDTLETDQDFGVAQIVALVNSVQRISSGAVDARTVPATFGKLGAADVLYPIEAEAEALYRAFRAGDLLPESIGVDGTPVELGPSNIVAVNVQDGSATDGVGERTAEVLEALGFTVAEVGANDDYGFAASLVLHPPDRADHAEVLADALGGVATNTGRDDVDELTLVIGSAFDPERFAPPPPPEGSEDEAAPDPGSSPADGEFVGAVQSDVAC
jgi:LCP family protein required for cell wall assembly